MKVIGIDEAGRGPVIGPMVMAGCVTTPEIDVELKMLGVKDSKMLSPAQRTRLFSVVKEKVIAYEIVVISARDIDNRESEGLNLNQLEAVNSVKIIRKLADSGASKAILDSPSNNPSDYKKYVESLLKLPSVEVVAEPKADVNYVNVSAASILAKVTRDALIEELLEKAKVHLKDPSVHIGSGYPSDPVTVAFLKKYWNQLDGIKEGFFRKTWASWKTVAQKDLFSY